MLQDILINQHSCYSFDGRSVETSVLKEIFDISKFGPTSFNCVPLRVKFIVSQAQKDILINCLSQGNAEKTRSAPVTAIFAYDLKFYEHLPQLFPVIDARKMFIDNEKLIFDTAFRNSSLQAAYFMMVAREKGLDCGPMSGFNEQKINDTFFKDTSWRVNFLCNLGYRKEVEQKKFPRLDFDQACNFI